MRAKRLGAGGELGDARERCWDQGGGDHVGGVVFEGASELGEGRLGAAPEHLDAESAVRRIFMGEPTPRERRDVGIGAEQERVCDGATALGLVLAAVGIYGVTSYSVVQRTNELGIRMALGAGTRDVLWLILSTGAGVIALGALIGSAGAVAVSRLLSAAIPTLPTRDPIALVALILFLVVVALVACLVPAGRAARVDPLVALRHD